MSSAPERLHRWLLLRFVVVSVICWSTPACQRVEGPGASAAPEVLVTEAASREVPVYREWLGTLTGSENAQIRARVTGHVLSRDYQEGSRVKQGDLLFEIDPRPFETALAQAKFELAQGIAIQRASQSEYERSQALFTKKVISEKEFINKTQLNESNRAKVKALTAALQEAQLNLDFCRVTSPIGGIVGIAQAQIGDLVGTGSNMVLASVSTLDPIKIIFPISEAEYLAVSDRVQETMNTPFDQRPKIIELLLAGGAVYPHKARLLAVDLGVKATTGTILVTALVPNPENVLRPGFFARARVVAEVLKDAVVVPQRAVKEIQGSYQLWVVGPEGRAEVRPVKVGERVGSDWVIASGLKAGEKVIVEGGQKVKEGMPVISTPWSPAAGNSTNPEAR